MATVTIHNLEVRFHVPGSDDAEFTRLFELHIRAWSRAQELERARRCHTDAERGIGDREPRP